MKKQPSKNLYSLIAILKKIDRKLSLLNEISISMPKMLPSHINACEESVMCYLEDEQPKMYVKIDYLDDEINFTIMFIQKKLDNEIIYHNTVNKEKMREYFNFEDIMLNPYDYKELMKFIIDYFHPLSLNITCR